jgi:hypothetical protein
VSGPGTPDTHVMALTIEPQLPEGWPADGFGPVGELMALLPDPSELEVGAWVAMAGSPARQPGLTNLFRRRPTAHLAVRCAALLARGYERVGGGKGARGVDLAWGRVPGDRASNVDG